MILGRKQPKKLRKRPFLGTRLYNVPRKKYVLWITISSFVVACLFAGIWLYMKTIGSEKYIIRKVTFAPESVHALRDITVYTTITETLEGRNYLWTKRLFKKHLVKTIQQQEPLIQDITITRPQDSVVYVTVTFNTPALLWQTPTHYFISYKEHLYPVPEDSILISDVMRLQLPKFSSGREDINGIYRAMHEEELVKSISELMSYFSGDALSELIYQPGGKRLFAIYKGKQIYLNLQKDIAPQIEKLLNLEKYRPRFSNVWTIDLGSRDEAIVK